MVEEREYFLFFFAFLQHLKFLDCADDFYRARTHDVILKTDRMQNDLISNDHTIK